MRESPATRVFAIAEEKLKGLEIVPFPFPLGETQNVEENVNEEFTKNSANKIDFKCLNNMILKLKIQVAKLLFQLPFNVFKLV